jgi:Tfp pilus assembly protein PilF
MKRAPARRGRAPDTTTGTPRELHVAGFLDRIKTLNANSHDSSLLFLLGSGASRQSGIKTGGEMVTDWLEILRREDPGHESVDKGDWATAQRLGIPSFDPKDPAASYPEVFARTYFGRRKEGFDYLEREIAGADPSYGYSVLAQILDTTRHRVVVTTNFDNLVIDAVSIYTKNTPLVCGHESLAGFIRSRPTRPQVVKVHRDLFYAPRNTAEELGPFPADFADALRSLFGAHVPVVIGYGGNDGSLMGVLEQMEPSALPQGFYWCYWNGGGRPRQQILDLISRHNGWLVGIGGFDELMIKLQDQLGLSALDDFLKNRGDERADQYKDRRDKLGQQLRAGSASNVIPTTAASKELKEQSTDTLQAFQSVMSRNRSHRTPRQWDSLAKLEPDASKRAQVYEDGLKALPHSPWMAEYAAFFFQGQPATRHRAEELHRRAVSRAPQDAAILLNYANFLAEWRKDADAADQMYKRALDVDPDHPGSLGGYASFLKKRRKTADAAERLYKRALGINPNHAPSLVNYANFLVSVRNDPDAAEALYQRAMAVDGKHPLSLGNYATFLSKFRHDPDAAEAMFKRALEADPKHASSLGNYAAFLAYERNDADAAEALFKRALDADPSRSLNLTKYANFLSEVRKDPNAAEAMFKRALAADPQSGAVLGTYANFLMNVRKDLSAAEEMYKQGVQAEPEDPINCGNYSRLLLAAGRMDEGLAMLNRAFAELPARTRPIDAECWMYAYCCRDEKDRPEALRKLKELITRDRISTREWDFAGVIAQAKKRRHGEAEWLPKLAEVLAGSAPPSALDAWPAWRSIESN